MLPLNYLDQICQSTSHLFIRNVPLSDLKMVECSFCLRVLIFFFFFLLSFLPVEIATSFFFGTDVYQLHLFKAQSETSIAFLYESLLLCACKGKVIFCESIWRGKKYLKKKKENYTKLYLHLLLVKLPSLIKIWWTVVIAYIRLVRHIFDTR